MSGSTFYANNQDHNKLFKMCQFCNAPLPKDSTDTLCLTCKERALFLEVKDFIRENDVNEFQVAEHFAIPLRIVKGWIKEGRIEYKEDANGIHIVSKTRCSRCGAPVTFGTRCTKCLKKMNKLQGFAKQDINENDKMHFLNDEIE